jgi:hypothetical protein
MTVTIEIRDVSLGARPTMGKGPKFARVTFSIKGDLEPEFDITFTVPTDHGLDNAISEAKMALELFAADLGTAAKNFTFP